MDYEKKYKDALIWMASLYDGLHGKTKEEAERFFPELKENRDERIRIGLIKLVNASYNQLYPYTPTKEEYVDMIDWLEKQGTPQVRTGIEWVNTIDDACDKRYSEEYSDGEYCHEQSFKWGFREGVEWLEKQGESHSQTAPKFTFNDVLALQCCMETSKKVQEDNELYEQLNLLHSKVYDAYQLENQGEKPRCKSALEAIKEEKVDNPNKIEPKFKIGDWIACNKLNIAKIIDINDDRYKVEFIDGHRGIPYIDYIDRNLHLWTIQDARDGDVLVHNGCTFIFMGIKDGIVQAIETTMLGLVNFGEPDKDTDYFPATKEQRELFFKKMEEEGYKWDAEKKELTLSLERDGGLILKTKGGEE